MLRFLQDECVRGPRLKGDEYSQQVNECVGENILSESGNGSTCADSDGDSCGEANTPRDGCVARDTAERACQGQAGALCAAKVSPGGPGGLLGFITNSRDKWLQAKVPAKRKSSRTVATALGTPRRQASQDSLHMVTTPPARRRSRSARAKVHPVSPPKPGTGMKAALCENTGCVKGSAPFFPNLAEYMLGHRKAALRNDDRTEEPLDICIDKTGSEQCAAVPSSKDQAAAKVASPPANSHIQCDEEATAPPASSPEAVEDQAECDDEAMVSPSSSPQAESPGSRRHRGLAALREAKASTRR